MLHRRKTKTTSEQLWSVWVWVGLMAVWTTQILRLNNTLLDVCSPQQRAAPSKHSPLWQDDMPDLNVTSVITNGLQLGKPSLWFSPKIYTWVWTRRTVTNLPGVRSWREVQKGMMSFTRKSFLMERKDMLSVTRKSFLMVRMNYGAAITPGRWEGLVSAKACTNNLLKS